MAGVIIKSASGPENRLVVRLTTGKMLRVKEVNLEVIIAIE